MILVSGEALVFAKEVCLEGAGERFSCKNWMKSAKADILGHIFASKDGF